MYPIGDTSRNNCENVKMNQRRERGAGEGRGWSHGAMGEYLLTRFGVTGATFILRVNVANR